MEVEECEQPSPGPREVLVRVHSAGLCGSDAHAYLHGEGYKWVPLPRIMGHEYSGTVETAGDEVEDLEVGQKVVEEPIHDCGHCFQCKNGQENVCQDFSITGMHGDGAYTVVEERHLHKVPDDVPLREAAITEPTSIAARAVLEQSDLTAGDNVLVEGPGPIGVLSAVIANSVGANVTVSRLEKDTQYRLPLIAEQGIDTVNVRRPGVGAMTTERTDGLGFDAVIDATGHRTGVEQAAECTRKGGQIVVVGIPGEPSELLMTPLVRGEIEVNTSYGSTWRNFEQALRLMENDEIAIDEIIDTSYDTQDPEEAFRAFLDSETCKPVFSFDDL